MRVNCGSGPFPLEGYCNIDSDPAMPADLVASLPPLPFRDESLEEVFAGHFLEHLYPWEAAEFLAECFRCLKPGGKLGVVVPDTREILGAYLVGQNAYFEHPIGTIHLLRDLDEVCGCFLYGTVAESQHRWSYDVSTLRRAIERAGFRVTGPIHRYNDPRLAAGVWCQVGVDAVKPHMQRVTQ